MTDARTNWGFDGPDDARTYLGEVTRLWIAWLIGLGGLMLTNGIAVLVAAVVTVAALLWLARPLQARAVRLVPVDDLLGSRWTVVGKGTTRDRVLRQLAYGEAPVEAAVRLSGASPWFGAVRRFVVLATVAGFALVAWLWLFAGSGAT